MNNMTSKKDFFYYIVLLLTFVVIVIGVTFAVYYFLHRQEEGSSAVYTGNLAIEYLSGDIILCSDLYPTESPTLAEEENVYKNNFRVKNLGNLDGILKVDLEINTNEFSDDTLFYKIYNGEEEELVNGVIPADTSSLTLVDNVVLESEETEDFVLMIWLQENGENQNQEMRKILSGTLKADANQKID